MSRVRKLAAIMFTDISGYTALMQQSERKAIEIRDRHRNIFNRVTHEHNGQIIQYYGDGTLSIFNSAIEAARCAISLQLEFCENPSIPVRIGLHMGDIIVDDEDIIGNAVNITSRIESLGIPGSILISNKIYTEVKNHEGMEVKALGTFHFKNDESPRAVYALVNEGLVVPGDEDFKGGKLEIDSSNDNGQITKKTLLSKKYIPGTLMVSILAIILIWVAQSQGKKIWARNSLLPEIQKLGDSIALDPHFQKASQLSWKAYQKALETEKYIPNNSILAQQWSKFSRVVNISTDPPGADVFIRPYADTSSSWLHLGKTPLDTIRWPNGMYSIRASKEGFFEINDVIKWRIKEYTLYDTAIVPEGMVPAKGNTFGSGDTNTMVIVSDFFVDKYEVSNKEYQAFVEAGGYRKPDLWKHPFFNGSDTLGWKEAMTHFMDQSGQPGPATWLAGTFPDGKEDFPVSGISWYEAAAYAEYAGKRLPSFYHFWTYSMMQSAAEIVLLSNIGLRGKGLAKRGEFNGMSRFGTFDVAGNVREWLDNNFIVNDRSVGKLIMGGAWTDQEYIFSSQTYQYQQAFDRNESSGFRCIKTIGTGKDQNCNQDFYNFHFFDMEKRHLVSEDQYQLLKKSFDYSKKEIKAKIEYSREEKEWIKQKITFEAPYAGNPMIAYLFLPKEAISPYQTIVYFPGADAFNQTNSEVGFPGSKVDFFIRTGRAVLAPVIAGSFERHMGYSELNKFEKDPHLWKERLVHQVKDIRRSIDYLETRPDIDHDKIGYFGYSQGGADGAIVIAVENRIRIAIFAICGLSTTFEKLPEADRANFLPRVKTPTLIINNLYDSNFPYEISQKPFIELLGTEKKDQKVILLDESGHRIPQSILVKESLDWFDKYFGKVGFKNFNDAKKE